MKYCMTCGHELTHRHLEHEGMTPYCKHCEEYRFPIFNTAISMIVVNPKKDKMLLIQQYQLPHYILVAGYVNQKEALEEALKRECLEEIGLEVIAYEYLRSEYFEKTNTLICNFVVLVEDESLEDVSDWEVDKATWFSFEEAKMAIKPDSLAERFLKNFMHQVEKKYVRIME